jgi:hypothetical protein
VYTADSSPAPVARAFPQQSPVLHENGGDVVLGAPQKPPSVINVGL